MIMKSLFLSCVLWAVLWSLSIQYATAQDSQIAIGEIENTPLLLNQEAEAPELGPIKVVPIGSPGTAIAEDIYGFMWFGGNSGLYRYDGTEMIRFQREPYDSSSLSETWVESLHAGSDGTLWVGTFGGGLNRFNPETETFMHFRHEAGNPLSLSQDTVTVLLEDSRGVLWVGTHGGLNRFNKSTETFTRFQHDPEDSTSISNNQIRAIYEDSNGAIWIGTGSPAPSETPVGEGGLNRFNSETQSFTRYMHDPDDPSSLLNNKVMSIYEDTRGMFWVGTMGDGLHTMDRETGRFTRYSNDPGDPLTLSVPIPGNNIELQEDCIGFGCGGVGFIYEDREGVLWIGGINSGVKRYQPGTGAISLHNFENSNFIPNAIWSAHQSQDGTLWIGGWGGAFKVSASVNSFPLLTTSDETFVSSISEDQDSGLWFSTLFDGLFHIDRTNSKFNQYQAQQNVPNTLLSDFTSEIHIDSSGDLWILYNYGGITHFDRSEETFNHLFTDESENSLSIVPKNELLSDRNDQLWVSTFGDGIYLLDPTSETILGNFIHDPNAPNSLSDNRVIEIKEDHDGNLWVGTENGLNFIDFDEFNRSGEISFRRYLPGRSIGPILEDDDGTIWVGTWGNGLLRFDPETGESDQFTTDDGLPANTVSAILQDDDGFIWVSTVEGQPQSPQKGSLSRFNPASISFANFTSQDGLPDIGFSMSALKSSDGLLFFGGIGGLTFFDPSLIQDPVYESPKIVLTGLHISNEQITPETSDLITRPMYLEDSLELSHDQNDVTIDYKAFAYINSDQVQYQYKLEPYDSEWVSARSQQSARYSQLSPGDYVFLVRTVDSRGGFNTEEATMAITIFPPWWQTWWAYGFYALMLAFGVFVVDRFQRRRLISKERERARERELEQEKKYSKQLQDAYSELEDSLQKLKAAQDQLIQQEKLASLGQLTAGIAHEIKNPLNFVNNFSDLSEEMIQELINAMKDGDLDEAEELANDISKNLQKIQEHGTRADSIVKSMLQHSRGGDGKAEPTPLNPLIKEYVNLAFHGMKAGEDPINVDIDLQLDDEVGEVPLVAEDFSRVILNITNNAFDAMRSKLTEDGGPGTGEKSPLEGSGDPESFREKRGVSSMEDYQPKLTVRTHQTDKSVTIDIEDNGPGIPDDMKDKILLPFFTTKKGTAGTGLGLSITNDIVKAHGGKMTATNMEESGARFTINLPAS